MSGSRFAVCIIYPGTTMSDIVHAVQKHNVDILNTEQFDPVIDYKTYICSEKFNKDLNIFALFISSSGSALIEEYSEIEVVIRQLQHI